MSANSKIEWTDRSDWNPIRGCTRVSPGCGGPGPHGGCYAEAMAARFSKPGMWGHGIAEMKDRKPRWTGKVELQEDRITLPLKWRKPAKIFVSSTSDLFHEALPDEAIDKIFAVMVLCPQHTFQVLTKRAERMREYFSGNRFMPVRERIGHTMCELDRSSNLPSTISLAHSPWLQLSPWPLPNVWLGISAERQPEWDERKDHLRNTPAAVRFASFEPLLGKIIEPRPLSEFIQWAIVGGESGAKARPMQPDWAMSLRDQCVAAGVPFFFKQWGEHAWEFVKSSCAPNAPFEWYHQQVGKKRAGRLLDGIEHNGMPT